MLLEAVEGGNGWTPYPRLYGEYWSPLSNNQFNQLDGRYWRDLSHTLSGMSRWSAARPRPRQGERFRQGVHGYGLACDAGGWCRTDQISDALIARPDLHRKWEITPEVLLDCIMSNPKRRYSGAIFCVEDPNARPRLTADGETAAGRTAHLVFDNPEECMDHGRLMAIKANGGWGYPFISDKRTMLEVRAESCDTLLRGLVHATYPEYLFSISARGIMTESELINSPTNVHASDRKSVYV